MATENLLAHTLSIASTDADTELDESPGIKSEVIWEHPDKPGHFIFLRLSAGGVVIRHAGNTFAIPLEDFLTLATGYVDLLLPTLPAITASPASGAHPKTVTLTCAVAGAAIRYTLDGTEPNQTSTLYTTPLAVNSALTIRAIALKQWWNPARGYSFIYT